MQPWQRDLGDSAFEFQRVVWPRIRRWCGGGELMPVEAVAAEGFTKQLDMLAGIDAWQIHQEKGIRGIASRVQWDDSRPGFPYRTFTVRKKRDSGADTEYAKRTKALNEAGGWIYPELTCQAFIQQPKREGCLSAVGVTRTRFVLEMIAMGNCRENRTSNASFWVVRWDEMERCGFKILAWPKDGTPQTPKQMELVEAPSEHAIPW